MQHEHPVEAFAHTRKESWSLRVADRITAFAGSMPFVWVHVVIFGLWIGTKLGGHDVFPFNFLTMVVSLEAIFLATFVMIGQNRQAAFAQHKAEHDYQHQETELQENTELTRKVHALVTSTELLAKAMHDHLVAPHENDIL